MCTCVAQERPREDMCTACFCQLYADLRLCSTWYFFDYVKSLRACNNSVVQLSSWALMWLASFSDTHAGT